MDRYAYLLMLLTYGIILNVVVIVLNRRKRHGRGVTSARPPATRQ
jgi:predicted neutral ceramidase superfamily lipid hydrolase